MVGLDEQEQAALDDFVRILHKQFFQPQPVVLRERIHRAHDGQIIVPVLVWGGSPSLSMALLMSHKSDQIYRQTGCRLLLAQCPKRDPTQRMFVRIDHQWVPIHTRAPKTADP